MTKIFKYQINLDDTTLMHAGAKIVHVAEQAGGLYVWAHVDPDAQEVDRSLIVAPTGGHVPLSGRNVSPFPRIGTVVMKNGLVWHIFDGGE